MDANGTPLTASRRGGFKVQQTTASLNAPPSQNARPALHTRPSLRLRPPAATAQNVEPSSPGAASFQTERLRRPSKMSLFNLFKSPRVERQHGYVEADLPAAPAKEMKIPVSPIVVQVTSEHITQRPVSVSSAKAANVKPPVSSAASSPSPPSPYGGKLRKNGPFEHPPLFQAYPQAMKEGVLEVSSIPVEALNRARHQDGERSGIDARRTSVLQPSPNALLAAHGLPKKIFILVTSGYLLQYAESGSSDRLPERVLSLGKDSAAFACDAVAGKHHVLQVSHAVDRDGIVISAPSSFFARLGMRNAAAKRMTSNFVLVLPNASEMDSWLTALRQEIDVIRGNKRRAETTRAPVPLGSLSTSALDRAPSHRYQVKRDPHRVTPASSPMRDTFEPPANIVHRKSEALTIDNIEMEASKLDAEPIDGNGHTMSSEQQSLRGNATFVDPWKTGQKGTSDEAASPASSNYPRAITLQQPHNIVPQPPVSACTSLDAESNILQEEQGPCNLSSLSKPGFSSHNFSRKGPPTPLTLHPQALPLTKVSATHVPSIVASQPVMPERSSPNPPVAKDLSDPSTAITNKSKRDSKLAGIPSAAELEALASEDTDGVGMLPDPSSLASSRPGITVAPVFTVRSNGARRVASFSMPLKVNPANTSALLPSGNPRRHSRMDEPEGRENLPVGLAITPPSTLSTRVSASYFDPSNPSRPASSSESTSSPSRLSLFPSPTTAPTTNPLEALQRTASVATRHTSAQAVYIGALKRPTSMQVRSDHAPFLSSVRVSGGHNNAASVQAAAPIRAMKPSRPTSSIETLPQRQSPLEALKALRFNSPIAEEGTTVFTTPPPTEPPTAALPELPPASVAPLRAGSRSSVRRSRHKSPLPHLDFGIPVIGLGPPAPPPQMPLPAPPTTSRAASPTAIHARHPSIERVAGLGISVS